MAFVKLQDGRSTYALDSLRLRSRRDLENAPQKGVIELFVRDQNLYVMFDDGTEYAIQLSLVSPTTPNQPTTDSFKENITITSTIFNVTKYVDLQKKVIPNTVTISVDRLLLYENIDYSLSTVGGVTRVSFTFIPLAPFTETLAIGDVIRVQYRGET